MSQLSRVIKTIDGNKTYIGFLAAGILGILWNYGQISDQDVKLWGAVVTAWTGISIRSAMKKSEKK